jgi:signal transduction histidine kinase
LFNAVKFSAPGTTVTISSQAHTDAQDRSRVIVRISNPVNPQPAEQELPGFGLGLNFVDNVVVRHKGRIQRHIPTSGQAEVRIDLPLHAD